MGRIEEDTILKAGTVEGSAVCGDIGSSGSTRKTGGHSTDIHN